MLTAERLRDLFIYEPLTGLFRWRNARGRWGRYPAGSIVGWIDLSWGYVFIEIDGRKHRAHRLAWLYVHGRWPKEDLDHKDLNKANNAIANLREATDFENTKNRRRPKHNKSGFKGVHLDARKHDKPIRCTGARQQENLSSRVLPDR